MAPNVDVTNDGPDEDPDSDSFEHDFELLFGESSETLPEVNDDDPVASGRDDEFPEANDDTIEDFWTYFNITNEGVEEADGAEREVAIQQKDAEDRILEAIAALYLTEQDNDVEDIVPENDNAKLDSYEEINDDDLVPVAEEVKPIIETPPPTTVHFESANGLFFVTVEPRMPFRFSQLGCSARVLCETWEIRLHNEGRLMLIDHNFMAQVELMNVDPLFYAHNLDEAANALLRQLRIVQIYRDVVTEERDRYRAALMGTIAEIGARSATNHACAVDAIQLYGIIQWASINDYSYLCQRLRKNCKVSKDLRDQANMLYQIEMAAERRNRFLARFHVKLRDTSETLTAQLRKFCDVIVQNRSRSLLNTAPQYLRDQLKDVPLQTIFQMHADDVKVFHDMDKVLNKEIFQKPLEDLAKRWTRYVRSLKQCDNIVSVVNPVYFSLCRSLEELILEITSKTDHELEELLKSDQSGWHPLKTIDWKSETTFTKCLQREYHFIFQLLKHFDPATGNRKPFDYQARRLLDGTEKGSMLNNFFRPFRRLMGRTQPNPLGIADEFYVWFCLLDDVLDHVLPENSCNLDMFEDILHNFVGLISKATNDQMETIRVITHNTARFIVQTYPFVSSDRPQTDEDKQILQSQLDAINRLSCGEESTSIFRDLIDVFSSYWKNRGEIIESIPSKNALNEMEQLKQHLLTIVLTALRKNVTAERMVDLFRSFNDFLVDLDDVSFDWLIKSVPGLVESAMIDLKFIVPVDNKWSDTNNQIYRVHKEADKFLKLFQLLLENESRPKHYVVEVIKTLLGYIYAQLERSSWTTNEDVSDSEQAASTSVLISSIRSSLMYLREQSEYVSFDLFLEERTKPFCNAVENSRSLADFIKRINLIKESFWYIRKQNEMSISEALQLYGKLNANGDYSEDRIRRAFQQYSDQFEEYMAEPEPEEKDRSKAGAIAELLRESVKPNLFKAWTTEFKQTELPKVLAGAAALWSFMVSEDVSSTGKFFKPHCIQILCVLRLLGADSSGKGVSKHLVADGVRFSCS